VVRLSGKQGEIVAKEGKAPLLTTERIYLREFEPADAASLYALNSNPEVLRYTGDSPFLNSAAAESFIRDYDHYRRFGYGRWAVILKQGERFIGYAGLRHDEKTAEVDLGFRLFTNYWSQGFATEAGRAALTLGFERFKLERIIGRSMRENLPSVSVLQKLGMEFSEVREESELLWLIYAIDQQGWQASTSNRAAMGP
jgi:RimJ/RimL family protein N-acetyltransferase